MSEISIKLKNISKSYKRYHHPVDRLKEILLPGKSCAENFQALKDINLEICQGETWGIIGKNGSGKSTLLQIIAGTLTPTVGEVQVNGRVSALLELGSGFNPEFTGRENIFFNGQILGLSRQEIEAKFDNIVAFAEIGDFLEQPVKTYSSGMVVRLAFAVAANVESQILIVDEALAVGDAQFQARCMKRIRQLKEQGVTILFVSHDSSSVKMLCQNAMLLSQGEIFKIGKPNDVVNHYIALLSAGESNKELSLSEKEEIEVDDKNGLRNIHRHGNCQIIITDIQLTDLQGQNLHNKLETGTIFKLIISLKARKEVVDDLVVGFSIRNLMGVVIYGTNNQLMELTLPSIKLGKELTVTFQIPCYLNRGIYTITVGLHSEDGVSYDWLDEVLLLEVFNSHQCDGLVDLAAQRNVVVTATE